MLNQKPINRVVFLDVETTSQHKTLADAPPRMQQLFKQRFKKDIEEKIKETLATVAETIDSITSKVIEEIYDQKAPLFAEFNKIICISMGVIDNSDPNSLKLRIKSFCDHDEKALLSEFVKAKSVVDYEKQPASDRFAFCAHNGMIFDFPVIAKRLIYNGLDLPYIFDFSEKKPWDIDYFIDTKNTWKFGVYDGNVSLDLLAGAFNVESSKMIMQGSDVKLVYYEGDESRMKSIQQYCEHDIYTLASIYLKMKNIQKPLTR